MKKLLLFALFFAAAFVNINNVSADSTSTGMGFDVDSTMYGVKDDYDTHSSYSYYVKSGTSYIIGWSRLETAVYKDLTDSDWALVIAKAQAEPMNIKIPGLFGIKYTYDSITYEANLRSDIDGSYMYTYYGDLYTNSGFVMAEPEPMIEPQSNEYTVSVEVSGTPKVSATTSFTVDELEFDFDHSGANQIYDVTFEYICVTGSCDYANELTYNRGLFLVDMTAGYNGNVGDFFNTMTLETSFGDKIGRFSTPIVVYKTILNTLYY